ncbi:hypothetical protein MJA45_27250 [Paenibacillus aurantius]|uniref:DUF998 domain-containing protein n=1 Tax=Paenibacillus aurantius TaxID=2918900 RepID=A0AA96LDY5_9BACL|nr:hypothetical protein [Paenibacillus aurantius]WNQ11253.1 hypothetical protein MJA45_27250 [Paenibacillus aurantius]
MDGQQVSKEKRFYRMTALGLMAGSLLVLIFRGMHGDLPAGDAHAAMGFIAHHPFYKGVHLGAVVGVMVTVLGLVSFVGTLKNGSARLVGWLSASIASVGAAVHIMEHSIDGHAGETLAHTWEAASVAEQAGIEHSAGTIFVALHGPALVGISMLWALAVLLLARVSRLEGYRSWLFWSGSIVSALTFVLCLIQFLYPDFIPGVLIFGLLVSLVQLWIFSLGAALWRRSLR